MDDLDIRFVENQKIMILFKYFNQYFMWANKAGVALRASVDIIAWSTPDVGECESGIPIVHLVPQGSSLDFNIEAADSDGLSEFIPSLKRVPQKSRDEGFMFWNSPLCQHKL